MTVIWMLAAAALAVSVAATWSTFRNMRVTRLLGAVTAAHNRRGAAHRALAAAYRAGDDPAVAVAAIAEAEKAVQEAEERLPRRSRHTRRYFASKEAS